MISKKYTYKYPKEIEITPRIATKLKQISILSLKQELTLLLNFYQIDLIYLFNFSI